MTGGTLYPENKKNHQYIHSICVPTKQSPYTMQGRVNDTKMYLLICQPTKTNWLPLITKNDINQIWYPLYLKEEAFVFYFWLYSVLLRTPSRLELSNLHSSSSILRNQQDILMDCLTLKKTEVLQHLIRKLHKPCGIHANRLMQSRVIYHIAYIRQAVLQKIVWAAHNGIKKRV